MNVICTGAQCVINDPDIISTGQENYFSITFSFDSAWDSLTKEVIFISNTIEQKVILSSNSCFIPKELSEFSGDILIGVIGKQIDTTPTPIDETIILTTNRAHLCKVEQGPNLTIDEIKQQINSI